MLPRGLGLQSDPQIRTWRKLYGAHPLLVHASQQLACVPTQALPPEGAVQSAAFDLRRHFVTPLDFVRQQVTRLVPTVDLAAHFTTRPLQVLRR